MDDWKLPWAGGCRCGRVRVQVTSPPLLAGVCHCTGCQKMSASAFSLTLSLTDQAFEVTEGEAVLGGLQQEPKHYFCPFCKSWMFTRPSDVPWLVNLRASVLDDHHWIVPFVEFYVSEKLPWVQTGARHAFDTVPATEAEFGPLLAEYAKEAPRP
jgi:hypothetical protein